MTGRAGPGPSERIANTIGKSSAQLFREFEGELDPDGPQGSGDVKYHLGATGKYEDTITVFRRYGH